MGDGGRRGSGSSRVVVVVASYRWCFDGTGRFVLLCLCRYLCGISLIYSISAYCAGKQKSLVEG